MVKIFLVVFTLVVLLSSTYSSRCTYGCACSTDDICEYYCENGVCQNSRAPGYTCSGYFIHPRECGTNYYCNPNSLTCQFKKSTGQWCTDDYWCSTGYCEQNTNTCSTPNSPFDWIGPALIVGITSFITLTLVFVIILIRRQRRRALQYCENPYVVLPPEMPYSYQHSCPVGEAPPPPYPGYA